MLRPAIFHDPEHGRVTILIPHETGENDMVDRNRFVLNSRPMSMPADLERSAWGGKLGILFTCMIVAGIAALVVAHG